MSGGPGRSQPLGYQGGNVNDTGSFGHGNLQNTVWKSPPNITDGDSIPKRPPSGLVPGLIAAGIFIMFLLCLYAILWKCMVSPPNNRKRKKKRAVTSPPSRKTLVV